MLALCGFPKRYGISCSHDCSPLGSPPVSKFLVLFDISHTLKNFHSSQAKNAAYAIPDVINLTPQTKRLELISTLLALQQFILSQNHNARRDIWENMNLHLIIWRALLLQSRGFTPTKLFFYAKGIDSKKLLSSQEMSHKRHPLTSCLWFLSTCQETSSFVSVYI